jgi:transposase-like protein
MSRPWSEVKSRRGAPKRVKTEGYACPNRKCPYSAITDAHVHALVGDGKHGQGERIQTFRCQACRTTFTARYHTPLYRLKTPSHQIAVVLAALAEGLDPSEALRIFGYRQATITSLSHSRLSSMLRPCTSASSPISGSHICSWMNCAPGCAAPDRCVFLWLAIDPLTKILPVLHLGPRTQHMAHMVIHSLRQSLAAFLPPALYE